ncbi:MAG: flagellar assembly protein FliW [Bryobacteraceae bacterium]|nr:flagellar assembly protein FliW [Bryobacteraceae bacterium]
MSACQTQHFGVIEYLPDQVVTFPVGLPAFEDERQFVLIEQSATIPVIFLQSLARPDLAFITLPMAVVEPSYRLSVSPEDLELLQLPPDIPATSPENVLCLAIVTVPEAGPPTANLMAPVVICRESRCAVQAIQSDSAYSHQHVLPATSPEERCS